MPSPLKTSLQSNTVSHWVGANLEWTVWCISFTEGIDFVCGAMGLLPVSLKCDDGGIDIHYANWGRTVPYVGMCSLVTGSEEKTSCYHSIYGNINVCTGLKQCNINLAFESLPNPCYGTARYIEVRYSCKGKYPSILLGRLKQQVLRTHIHTEYTRLHIVRLKSYANDLHCAVA